MAAQTTRRALFGGAGLAGVALIAPAIATSSLGNPALSRFRAEEARYRATVKWFEGLPSHLEVSDPAAFTKAERKFLGAVTRMDMMPCDTLEEFADAFLIACDNGHSLPNEDTIMKLVRDAQHLTKKGG